MEEQTDMWDWDQEIQKFREEEQQQFRADKVQNEEILDLSGVTRMDERIFEFTDPDGNVRKVKRKFYIFEDRKVMIPISLHRKIMRLVEKLGKDIRVQIFVSGSGIKTRYDVIPLPKSS